MLFIVLFSACSIGRYNKFDYNHSNNPWIDDFKDQVFFACLRESYKSDSLFNMIEKKDAFNPYDGLGPEDFKKIRELAKKFVANMPPPAMCDGCKADVNYYMAHSLHYYASKELDAIARKQYKEYSKNYKETWKSTPGK